MLSYWVTLALVFSCYCNRGLSGKAVIVHTIRTVQLDLALMFWYSALALFPPCTVQCRSGPQTSIFPIESEAEITSNLNSLPGHGPSEANLTNAGWCSETLLSTVGPYLQFNFSDVYAVYSGIISGVNDTNVSSYITSLQVEADFLGTGKYYLITGSRQTPPGVS